MNKIPKIGAIVGRTKWQVARKAIPSNVEKLKNELNIPNEKNPDDPNSENEKSTIDSETVEIISSSDWSKDTNDSVQDELEKLTEDTIDEQEMQKVRALVEKFPK